MERLNRNVPRNVYQASQETRIQAARMLGRKSEMLIRIVVSVAVLIAALIHLEQWFLVFRDNVLMGPAMLANFVGGVVIGMLVLVWQHWLPFVLAVLFGAATLGAFLVSTTPMGLFGVHEHWTIWEVFVAAVVEIVAIVGGLVGLRAYRNHPVAVRA